MDTEALKQKLEAEKAKLTAELSSFATPDKNEPGDWDVKREENPGGSDVSDEVANELEGLVERKATELPLEKQLQKVNLALEKMTTGKYGICEISGEPIEADRLEANPSARTCKHHMEEEDGLPL
ncbi:MAG: TraR/DksA C4-type zinc finger protein [Candidatus Vogelbacteria bacterium]|nr:TraR/DksA C4-type zinc finger protein [Candidatus Vogelbacteria bacterium]